MRTRNSFPLFLGFLILSWLFLVFPLVGSSDPSEWYWSPDVQFYLKKTNVTIKFSDWATFNGFIWDDKNASEITLLDLATPTYILNFPYNFTEDYVDSNLLLNSTLGFSDYNYTVGVERLFRGMRYIAVKNGTLTAQSKNDVMWRLMATISNITGKATVQIYTAGYRPRYVKVGGAYTSEWTYDRSTQMLTFNVTAASPRKVEAIYGITDEETASVGILGSIMVALGKFRKKIGDFKKEKHELIEKAIIVTAVLIIALLVVWVCGIYGGLW